jgi:signal transduction histidine kinase
MLIALFIGYIGAFFLAKTMVKPIQQLAFGMRDVSEGKLNPLELSPRSDELGWLGDEINVTIHKLKELDDMKQNFFSRITHELRSPLIAIDGLVSMILKGMYGDTSTKIKELLLTAQNNSSRLKRLVDDLLTASRLEARREDVDAQDFDLEPLINDVHTLYSPLSHEKGIMFDKKMRGAPIHVWAEPEKVQHILTNLLSNAFKFTKSGEIYIAVDEEPRHIRVSVADTGIGIPKEEQEKVFDKFFRSTAAKKIKGTGLGLNIVKDLVELQGGRITVAARNGGGTIFSFTLPKRKAV